MRYLGVDPGGHRIGLAVGDDSTGVVSPVEVVAYDGAAVAAQLIADAAQRLAAGCVVVGLPTLADGSTGPAARRSRLLAEHLRTLGVEAGTVSRIFMVQGSAVGAFGVLCGVIVGSLLALWIGDIVHWVEYAAGFRVFDPDVYFISQLPSRLLWQDVLVISGLGFGLSLLATLYPSYRAGQILPAEALRYDH